MKAFLEHYSFLDSKYYHVEYYFPLRVVFDFSGFPNFSVGLLCVDI